MRSCFALLQRVAGALARVRQCGEAYPLVCDVLIIAATLLVSRAALVIVGYCALQHQGNPPSLSEVLCRFDCGWYLSIAGHGYSVLEAGNKSGATNFAFFPLFPLLVRGVAGLLGSNLLTAALVTANCCFVGALLYVRRYAVLIGASRKAALLAVALLCVFPQSIVFSAPYTESLFMLLLAAAIYHLLREQFLAAAIAAALLSAARPTGVLFIVFALGCALHSVGLRGLLTPWQQPQRYLPIVFAPLGMFLFWCYCLLTVNDAFAFSHAELHGWGYRFTTPWHGLWFMLRLHGRPVLAGVCSIAVLACSLLLCPRRRFAEFALCLAFILLMWSSLTSGSIFRYWLVLFPVWVEVARRLESRPMLAAAVFLLLAAINGGMMWAWTLQNVIAV